jgi:hypothetical protein
LGRAATVWVNGVPATSLSATNSVLALSGGALVETSPDSYRVIWNTGEVLDVTNNGSYLGLTTTLGPNDGPGSVKGLLGSDSGQANDFQLSNGTVLPQPLAASDLYGAYADAWRVTDANSVLNYGTNQDTATFTDTNFPADAGHLPNLPGVLVQQAAAAVVQAGITDPGIASAAELDFLETGDPAFLTGGQNAAQQGVVTTAADVTQSGSVSLGVGVSAVTAQETAATSGTTAVDFMVTLTGATTADTAVGYAVTTPSGNYLTAAAFGGVLPSGTITIAAGQTTGTIEIDVPQTALGSLPTAALQVAITAPADDAVFAATAQTTLVNAAPIAGPPAVPQFGLLSGPGVLTTNGTASTIDIGTLLQGQMVPQIRLAVANAGTTGADSLGGMIAATSSNGFAPFGTGPMPIVAAGANFQGLGVSIDTGTLGAQSELFTLSPTDQNETGYSAALPARTLVIEDTVVGAAQGTLVTTGPLDLGNVRVGGTLATTLDVANTAPVGSAALDVVASGAGDVTTSGTISQLAAGVSNASLLVATLGTGGDGVQSGNVSVAFTSDAGNGNTLAAGGAGPVAVTGTVYDIAHGTITAQPLIVHQGTAGTVDLTVTNTNAADGFSENLVATILGHSGGITTASGSVNLAAGASNGNQLTASFAAGAPGTLSGDVKVGLESDGTGIDGLGVLDLGTIEVPVAVTVDNYADIGITDVSNGSAVSNGETIHLGTVALGGSLGVTLSVSNATSGPADVLSGGLVAGGGTASFTNTLATAFTDLAAGASQGGYSVLLHTGTSGTFSETITVNGTGSNASGYSGSLTAETFTVEGTVACYLHGTHIATPSGEIPIEDLAIGDVVLTHSGGAQKIRWIGRRSYGSRFVARNPDILPVRIRANALANGVPHHDLWVSPQHAMFIDGVLVPAICLVNGRTILQEQAPMTVAYLHIELAHHDVILAEGAPSESFEDDDSRMMFHNAAEFLGLYPDAACRPARYCAPRVTEGRAIERIRERLRARAGLRPHVAGPLLGCVERVEDAVVEGWARNPLHPSAPVCLDVLVDGEVVALTLANLPRSAGGAATRDGFRVRVPAVFTAGVVQVRRSLDQAVLPRAEALREAG